MWDKVMYRVVSTVEYDAWERLKENIDVRVRIIFNNYLYTEVRPVAITSQMVEHHTYE